MEPVRQRLPAVTYESFHVCANVEECLRSDHPQDYYSEAAEVAEVIRRALGRSRFPVRSWASEAK